MRGENALFLRNCWQVAAFSSEIIGGRLLARTILDERLVLFRTLNGDLAAFEDRCPHRSAPLSRGRIVGETLECGYHGLCFDKSGQCVSIPGQTQIPPRARVRVYPILERHKCVWIWMGDAQLADPDQIPDVRWMDDPQWVASDGYHHLHANYLLINDNLLDLSHETYVHARTIGNEAVADSPVTVHVEPGEVRLDKLMTGCHPPPFYQYLAKLLPTHRVDRWQRTAYRPPGYIVIDVGVQPLDDVAGANRVEGRVINLITPETATSTHYFWAFARNFRLEEPAVTEFLRENVRRTFDEDKEMLEAQQRNLGSSSHPDLKVWIKADAGPTQGRKALQIMSEREHQCA